MAATPDLPGCRTYGDSEAEALTRVVDAALTMVAALVKDREDIPTPSAADGRPTVRLPLLCELKVRLYQAMRTQKVSQTELARRLGRTQKEVWRLLDVGHASKLDQLEAAFAALGYSVGAEIRAVA